MTTTYCRATLNYGGAAVDVDILDGRTAALPGWRECGFELVRHSSEVDDWSDDDEIARTHYAEIEALARDLTGADHALVSDHVKRNAQSTKREREQSPVRLVHSDFAAGYDAIVRGNYRNVRGRGAATLARSGITAEDIERAPRIVMMQFWRNLGAPKMDLPVAWCDSRTVSVDEAKPFHYNGYVAGGRSFDALGIVPPQDAARHDWYTFPELTRDEVVAFRTYDTELVDAGKTFFTPHSAFPDPGATAPRFSIELRVMCVFAH